MRMVLTYRYYYIEQMKCTCGCEERIDVIEVVLEYHGFISFITIVIYKKP